MRYAKDLILLVLMIGAGFLVRWQWSELTARMGRLGATQLEFAQRARRAATNPDEDGYLTEIQKLLRTYKEDVAEIRGGRIEWSDQKQDKLVRQLENGAIEETQYREQMEVLAIAKSAYETLLTAEWRSQLTDVGTGDTRLDIYRLRQSGDSNVDAALEADFFLWGIGPETVVTWGRTETKYWREAPPNATDALALVGREEGPARPAVFIQAPTQIAIQFPTGVAIGTFRLPRIPSSANRMDLALEYTVQNGDKKDVSRLAWTAVPISPDWRQVSNR